MLRRIPWEFYSLGTGGCNVAGGRPARFGELAPAYARIQAHLADALRASGDLGRAKKVLDQSEATLNERPSPQDLNAVLCATRARLVEVENPHLARGFYELAIERLAAPRFRSLRVDTLLDLAAWHLRHEDPSSALANLRGAERALGAADEPLLMSRLETYRAAVGFGFAAEAPRLERIAHLAGAVGHGVRVLTIPPQIDPRAAEEGRALLRRLANFDLAFEARVGCVEIERLRERAQRDPGGRESSGLGSARSRVAAVEIRSGAVGRSSGRPGSRSSLPPSSSPLRSSRRPGRASHESSMPRIIDPGLRYPPGSRRASPRRSSRPGAGGLFSGPRPTEETMDLLKFRRRGEPAARCATASKLHGLRDSGSLGKNQSRALAIHLTAPCRECWDQLRQLPPLAPPDGGLGDTPSIVETRQPVALALRTLGGWPPEPWLSPARRSAKARVGEPFGFLRLVLEEARAWASHDLEGFVELGRWVEMVGRWPDPHRQPSLSFRARTLAIMAEVFTGSRANLEAGWELIQRSVEEAGTPENPDDIELAAFQAEVRARLSETTGPAYAAGEYALAVDYLVAPRHADRRAETFLRYARYLVRTPVRVYARESPSLEQAAKILDRVWSRLKGQDEARFLHQSYRQVAASLALRWARDARPGLERWIYVAEAIGHVALTRPLPKVVDPALAYEHALLERFLEEEQEARRPEAIREAIESAEAPEVLVHLLAALAIVEKGEEHQQRLHEVLEQHSEAREHLRDSARRLGGVLDRFVGVPAVRRLLVASLQVLAAEGIDV